MPGMDSQDPDPRPARILVVDDEDHTALAVSLLLAQAGYEVSTAGDGRTALDRLAGRTPDQPIALVLLDLYMPVLDGLGVLDALAAVAAGVPVIVMSGYAPGTLDGIARRHRLAGVLHKPFDPATLLALVAAALGRAAHPAHP